MGVVVDVYGARKTEDVMRDTWGHMDAEPGRKYPGWITSDGEARVIASHWHGGQKSALYSFMSTGNTAGLDGTTDELMAEIESEVIRLETEEPNRTFDMDALWALLRCVYLVGNRGPIDGWHRLWGDMSYDGIGWWCMTCAAGTDSHTDTAHEPNWVRD